MKTFLNLLGFIAAQRDTLFFIVLIFVSSLTTKLGCCDPAPTDAPVVDEAVWDEPKPFNLNHGWGCFGMNPNHLTWTKPNIEVGFFFSFSLWHFPSISKEFPSSFLSSSFVLCLIFFSSTINLLLFYCCFSFFFSQFFLLLSFYYYYYFHHFCSYFSFFFFFHFLFCSLFLLLQHFHHLLFVFFLSFFKHFLFFYHIVTLVASWHQVCFHPFSCLFLFWFAKQKQKKKKNK